MTFLEFPSANTALSYMWLSYAVLMLSTLAGICTIVKGLQEYRLENRKVSINLVGSAIFALALASAATWDLVRTAIAVRRFQFDMSCVEGVTIEGMHGLFPSREFARHDMEDLRNAFLLLADAGDRLSVKRLASVGSRNRWFRIHIRLRGESAYERVLEVYPVIGESSGVRPVLRGGGSGSLANAELGLYECPRFVQWVLSSCLERPERMNSATRTSNR